jgi:antitoxin (DNA-binding transcriptional repressor) of toxin-antitoxin stability system
MNIGVRELSKNPSKYLKVTEKEDVVICYRGKPIVVMKSYSSATLNSLENIEKSTGVDIFKTLEDIKQLIINNTNNDFKQNKEEK